MATQGSSECWSPRTPTVEVGLLCRGQFRGLTSQCQKHVGSQCCQDDSPSSKCRGSGQRGGGVGGGTGGGQHGDAGRMGPLCLHRRGRSRTTCNALVTPGLQPCSCVWSSVGTSKQISFLLRIRAFCRGLENQSVAWAVQCMRCGSPCHMEASIDS